MLELPNVTLICLTNAKLVEHRKALDISSEKIKFGAVKLIHRPDIDTIEAWNKAIFYELGDYVDTDYALLIHSNGFVVNPDMWNSEWLSYDWCASPWPLPTDDFSYRDINGKIQRVGNSVGLRSKKLLDLPKKINIEWKAFHGFTNEDGAIAVNYRHLFEKHGCKFMPLEEAIYFGRENEIPENKGVDKPFVFHNYNGRNAIYRDL